MSWVRFDDNTWSDPDWLALSPDARDLFSRLLFYCGHRLNDGAIGRAELRLASAGQPADPSELIAELIPNYLVETPAGWQVVEPFRWLRPATAVQRDREIRRLGGLARAEQVAKQAAEQNAQPVPVPVPAVPDSRIPTVPAADWGPRPEVWQRFREAWQRRGFRLPPTDAQRQALWPAIDARPEAVARVVSEAPIGTCAADVVGLVLEEWQQTRAAAAAADVERRRFETAREYPPLAGVSARNAS